MVLLDMDGTLLDLRFDNYFWLELLPERLRAAARLALEAARAPACAAVSAASRARSNWYCIDFWTP